MTVVLTAGARPIFLNGNFLTRHADAQNDLILSSGTALRHRLYDMDPASKWQGDVADDDIDETVIFGLWDPGFQSSHDIDFLAALGHNIKAFDWDLSDNNGATFPGANQQSITGQTEDFKITSLSSSIAADKVKFTAHSSQAEDDSLRQIGSLVVGKVLIQPTIGMARYSKRPNRMKARSATMHDGSKRSNLIFRSDATAYFKDFGVMIAGLGESEANTIEGIVAGNAPFIFIPEPGDRPKNMYLGKAVPGTVIRDYLTLSKSGGEFVSFDFEEYGGA